MKMVKKTINNKEISEAFNAKTPTFPRYTTQIINLANQTSQGTRPKVVGQMSELTKIFNGKTLAEWVIWYTERYPDSIGKAVDKISGMIRNYVDAIGKIDDVMIRSWVSDLVFNKTFCGLRCQSLIIPKLGEIFGKTTREATPDEESNGIDGYIGNKPVQIKADTYKSKEILPEEIKVPIVYYKKTKSGISFEYNPDDFK